MLGFQFQNQKFSDLEREFAKKKLLCMTDAKSLENTLNKDAGQPADKREPVYAQWLDTKPNVS